MVRFFFTVVGDRLVKGRQVRVCVVHPVISVTLRTTISIRNKTLLVQTVYIACNRRMLEHIQLAPEPVTSHFQNFSRKSIFLVSKNKLIFRFPQHLFSNKCENRKLLINYAIKICKKTNKFH
jgi:hypothetical protein